MLRVTLDDPESNNPALVRALVEAGAAIRTITEETRTLDHVYLELVGAPPGVEAA